MFAYMVGFSLSENSNANKNFRGAKGVAIATKFTQKNKNVRNIVPISTYMIGFCCCRIQICYLNFSGNKQHCYDNQILRRIGFSGFANSNTLLEFFREQMTLIWQPHLGRKTKLQKLGHNFGMQNTFGICVQRICFGSLNSLMLNSAKRV